MGKIMGQETHNEIPNPETILNPKSLKVWTVRVTFGFLVTSRTHANNQHL